MYTRVIVNAAITVYHCNKVITSVASSWSWHTCINVFQNGTLVLPIFPRATTVLKLYCMVLFQLTKTPLGLWLVHDINTLQGLIACKCSLSTVTVLQPYTLTIAQTSLIIVVALHATQPFQLKTIKIYKTGFKKHIFNFSLP